ncbi:MAG TPA: carboxypeptidase regulatory-like domain-containing protein [Thermoanaerobaculia bacterium]|jgi:hypothetical protein
MRLFGALSALLIVSTAARAAPIAVRFEPATRQVESVEVRRAADEATAATTLRITGGALNLPATLTPPLVIERHGFEPVTYTAADLAGRKPIVLRALGTLTGTISRRSTKKAPFTWLLRHTDAQEPVEIDFVAGADQRFSIPLPAGVYQGAVIGEGLASYTIAAIVIRPGETTEPKPIALEPTAPAAFRVVDQATNEPVAGARVEWNPPSQELNSGTSRILFRKRWSGTTASDGRVSFPSIGPLPIPVRWRVEAPSYPPVDTPATQLRADARLALADVALRRPSVVTVRVNPPRKGELPRGTLVLLSGSDESLQYRRDTSVPLKAGETLFRDVAYGRKRLQVTGESGETLLYEDFRVDRETAAIELLLEPVELHGKVTRGSAPVSGVRVEFTDPHDPAVRLARTETNFLGRYETTTWKRGALHGYAIENSPAGKSSGSARIDVTIDAAAREQEANFALPSGGFTLHVVDAVSEQPVPVANVHQRIQFRDGVTSMRMSETDGEGKLEFANMGEGTAKLFIKARGYRTAESEVVITSGGQPDVRIALQPARAVSGRVVGPEGMPIAGALLEGGYAGRATQAAFETRTNAEGEFRFESAPMAGTTFYAMAPGYALTVTTLRAGDDNVIRLERPSNGMVYLTGSDGAPPRKVYRLAAAPQGGAIVPQGVLDDLARVNGLTSFQLLANGRDGATILAEFLGAGAWDLFLTKRGGDPYLYERIGSVTTPTRGVQTLKVAE